MLIVNYNAIRTYCFFTCVAVVRKLGFMLLTTFLFLLFWALLVETLQHGRNFIEKATVHKLIHSQRTPAVWTLLLGFSDPLLKAVATGKLTAAWTHHGLVKLTIANKTFQNFLEVEFVWTWLTLCWRDLNWVVVLGEIKLWHCQIVGRFLLSWRFRFFEESIRFKITRVCPFSLQYFFDLSWRSYPINTTN